MVRSSSSSWPSSVSFYNNQPTTQTAAVNEEGQFSPSLYSVQLGSNKIESVTAGLQGHYISLLKKQSSENAETIADYVFAMNIEVNPSIAHRSNQIRTLSYLSEFHKQKPFSKMTRNDIIQYLESLRRPEELDPLHNWIGTYNLRRTYLMRFFKWLYNPEIEPSKRPVPDVVKNIPSFKRKEQSIYRPTDLWIEQDDALFLKYCPNKRDRCYHMLAHDSLCHPSEILGLKIKSVIFKTTGEHQYAEVLVSGKMGARHIPLFSALPYIKDWLDAHPQRGNPNAYLVPSMDRKHKRWLYGSSQFMGCYIYEFIF
jgi:hypothetical protein